MQYGYEMRMGLTVPWLEMTELGSFANLDPAAGHGRLAMVGDAGRGARFVGRGM